MKGNALPDSVITNVYSCVHFFLGFGIFIKLHEHQFWGIDMYNLFPFEINK